MYPSRIAPPANADTEHSPAASSLFWRTVALRRGRVDILRRQLSITEAATQVSGRLVFGEPKTHRRRLVHLPRFVAEELAQHLRSRPSDPDALVWGRTEGTLRYNQYRSRVWDPGVAEAGLAGLTPHALRHTCASLMRAEGADVKAIQTQLGHRSPMITLIIYTHLFEGRFRLCDGPSRRGSPRPGAAQERPKRRRAFRAEAVASL